MGRPAKTVDAADGAMSAKTRAARKNAEKSLQGSGRVIAPSYLTVSQKAIFDKPQAHKFFSGDKQADLQGMSHIGG